MHGAHERPRVECAQTRCSRSLAAAARCESSRRQRRTQQRQRLSERRAAAAAAACACVKASCEQCRRRSSSPGYVQHESVRCDDVWMRGGVEGVAAAGAEPAADHACDRSSQSANHSDRGKRAATAQTREEEERDRGTSNGVRGHSTRAALRARPLHSSSQHIARSLHSTLLWFLARTFRGATHSHWSGTVVGGPQSSRRCGSHSCSPECGA